MSDENFMRSYVLKCGKMKKKGFQIGNIDNTNDDVLHIAFSIEKSSSESPNSAKIQIWNLSDKNLKVLDTKDCVVELKAGYGDYMSLVLVGNISSVITVRDNADRLTELEVVDGLVELRDTNISVSMNGKVNCKDVYNYIAKKMGVSIFFAKDLSFKNCPNGFSYVGKAKNALQKLAKCCGHKWTIQNQVLQITLPDRAASTRGYLLTSDTGLIGTPKRITINGSSKKSGKDVKIGWEIEYLLNGAIGINDIIQIRSSIINGYYLVYKITMDGDNIEGDWICTAQVLEIKSQSKLEKKKKLASAMRTGIEVENATGIGGRN